MIKTLNDVVLEMIADGKHEHYFELKKELNDLLNQIEKVTKERKVLEIVKQIKDKL